MINIDVVQKNKKNSQIERVKKFIGIKLINSGEVA